MLPCGSPFWGLDSDAFWSRMERCFGPLLETKTPDRSLRPDPQLLPTIALDPPPAVWPDPSEFVHDDED